MPKQKSTNDKAKQRVRTKASSSFRPAALAGSKSTKLKSKLKLKSRSKPKKTVAVAFKGSRSLSKPLTMLRSGTKAKKRLHKRKQNRVMAASSRPPKGLKKKTKIAAAAKNMMMPVMPKQTNKKKPTHGTPVLFLVKDPGNRLQSVSCTSENRGRKKPLQPPSHLPAKVFQYTRGRKQTQPKMLPRYVATGSIHTDSRLARQGVDFFHHLGQRKATDSKENSWKPPVRLSGGGWNPGPAVNLDAIEAEVPLTHRLPIIDFISTNEFERMCTKSRATGTTSLCSATQRM